VHGDAGRLEQVLFNLLTNALTYARGDAPIDMRLRREGGAIALTVRDYGRGIAAADLPDIFSRFYQACADRPPVGNLTSACSSARNWSACTVADPRSRPPMGRGPRSRRGCRCWTPARAPRVSGASGLGPRDKTAATR